MTDLGAALVSPVNTLISDLAQQDRGQLTPGWRNELYRLHIRLRQQVRHEWLESAIDEVLEAELGDQLGRYDDFDLVRPFKVNGPAAEPWSRIGLPVFSLHERFFDDAR